MTRGIFYTIVWSAAATGVVIFNVWPVACCLAYSHKTKERFETAETVRIADNILTWQAPAGGWPKNTDTMATAFTGDTNELHATFDNGATVGELRFLASAYNATKSPRYRQAFLKGFDYILNAQYASGGWPQSWPAGKNYTRHITFNDNTMVNLMQFIRDFGGTADCNLVDEPPQLLAKQERGQAAAKAAFERGIECILKCQIRVNGKLAVWCAQHDEIDYSPRPGRSFELVSLSGYESAGILRLLMSIEKPSPAVVEAVEGGVRWFESARINGIREKTINGDKVIIEDANAPPIWARFYEIETNRPIFAGRDGVKKYRLSEIEAERRNDYAWYGYWGEEVAEDYARWRSKRFLATDLTPLPTTCRGRKDTEN